MYDTKLRIYNKNTNAGHKAFGVTKTRICNKNMNINNATKTFNIHDEAS